VLERYRPGFKRWGPKWISEKEYDDIKIRDRELEAQLTEQAAVLNRVGAEIKTATAQYNTAYAQALGFSNHVHVSGNPNGLKKKPTSIYGLNQVVTDANDCALCRAMNEATSTANDLGAELQALGKEQTREQARYDDLKKRLTKPTWPARFPPIDPNAPPPKPPDNLANVPVDPAVAPAPVPAPATAEPNVSAGAVRARGATAGIAARWHGVDPLNGLQKGCHMIRIVHLFVAAAVIAVAFVATQDAPRRAPRRPRPRRRRRSRRSRRCTTRPSKRSAPRS
jgi:hypothetical protein